MRVTNWTFWPILAALMACVHISRQPAQVVPPMNCEQAFEAAFNVAALNLKFQRSMATSRVKAAYFSSGYLGTVRGFMAHAAGNSDCEVERDVTAFSRDIAIKLRFLKDRLSGRPDPDAPEDFLDDPLFANSAKFACYSECSNRSGREVQSSLTTCEAQCGVEPQFATLFTLNPALQKIAMTCFAPKDLQVAQADFLALFNKYVPTYLAAVKALQNLTPPGLQLLAASRDAVAGLQAEFSKFQQARVPGRCGPEKYVWLPAAGRATVHLRSDRFEGSGFYIRSKAGRFLVTAAHVPQLFPKVAEHVQVTVTANNGSPPLSDDFKLLPGQIDIVRDITLAPEKSAGPSFKLADVGEVPQLGQRFYVVGFPAAANGKLKYVRCTFLGYGPRQPNQKDFAYRLLCPGAEDLHGYSGGPTLDAQGRVWGVNSSSELFSSTFNSTPVAWGADKRFLWGIQEVLQSDLCYGPNEYEPHRCEVMPNMLEVNGP